MKNKKIKNLLGAFFITIIIFSCFGTTIYAAINNVYGEPAGTLDTDLDEKVKDTVLAEHLAKAVYYVACWIEGTIGDIFESLTGTNEFPWADRVIFNTVAFLDVNFLNPEPGSLFLSPSGRSDTALAGVIKKIYGSIMTMSIGFLSIIVGIMSIKLAISTVASEKAKYKEAIVKFATSLVMLFCIHYGIALVFYINERLVGVASSILTDSIAENSFENNLDLSNSLTKENLVELFAGSNSLEKDEKKLDALDLNQVIYVSMMSPSYDDVYGKLKGYLDSGSAPFANTTSAEKYIRDNVDIASSMIKKFQDTRYAEAAKSLTDNASKDDKAFSLFKLSFDIWMAKGGKLDDGSVDSTAKSVIDTYINNEMVKAMTILSEKTDEQIAKDFVKYYPSGSSDLSLSENVKGRMNSDFNFVAVFNGADFDTLRLSNGSVEYRMFATASAIDSSDYKDYAICLVLKDSNNELQGWDGKNTIGYTNDVNAIKKLVAKWRSDEKYAYYDYIYKMYSYYGLGNKDQSPINNDPVAIISSLSTYFKDSVWGYEIVGGQIVGWKTTNFSVTGAFIYAIFLVQSLMIFFAYIKRFFYVTILALFAPVVVLYNFMVGAIS